jgi:hypothetical protein
MTESRRQLIERLTSTLEPVSAPVPPTRLAILWWISTWAFVAGLAALYQPLRPGALAELATHGQFFFESVLGLAAAAVVAVFAFGDAIPARARHSTLVFGLILTAAWMLAYVIGLEYPALAPSMAGKRAHCFLETLIYGVPPALAGIYLCRRYYVLAPVRTTALITLAAAMVPALLMQFACMYDPAHILTHHLLPIALIVATAVAGHRLVAWWATVWRGAQSRS